MMIAQKRIKLLLVVVGHFSLEILFKIIYGSAIKHISSSVPL